MISERKIYYLLKKCRSNVCQKKITFFVMKCCVCGCPNELQFCPNCHVPMFTSTDNHISFAFIQNANVTNIDSNLLNSIVLDYFKSSIQNAEIDSFNQLKQLRLSHCSNLRTIILRNLPSLLALDASDCEKLTECEIINCPNLKALDLSFCPSLLKFRGDFPKLEYISLAHTQFVKKPQDDNEDENRLNIYCDKLPNFPSAKFIDISNTSFVDISSLYECQNLQKLIMERGKNVGSMKRDLNMGKLLNLPNFTSILADNVNSDFKGCPQNHNLKNICMFRNCKIENYPDFSKTNAILSDRNVTSLEFDNVIYSGDWINSYRLLYGPWPTPPNDSQPNPKLDLSKVIFGKFMPPKKVDLKKAANHIMGAIFGTAIGDNLGIFGEGHYSREINMYMDYPFDITYDHPLMTNRGIHFHRGSFTDDTALMLMFIRSIVSTGGKFDPNDAGTKILHWIDCGLDEHLDGFGIGQGPTTAKVAHSPSFTTKSIAVSKKVWEDGGKYSAANGGVMRTGACGCFQFWNERKVIKNATEFCQVTHYDPRCVFSCVLVSLIISRLIQQNVGLIRTFDLEKTIQEAKKKFPKLNYSEIDPFLYASNIEDLRLTDQVPPTLNTMACAIYVLRQNFTYEQGIEAICRGGGDVDTNNACAGAVLGAKWGFDHIPIRVLNYMWYGGILYRDTIPFLNMMGMNFEPPKYEYFMV
ncbi:hypothetical protein TRFO_04899 [Tritrichomonas foetus]|uniref:ADP-ribosylhydrolase ARH3 n=1 Tax=Tritrichomonas foetus TaxID=1144522 RepID=A0A1J4KEV3_9EUKA|nr:hypothetical protein TRFO_04899 [Tritrichomonas foetus]|eukprot:OHT08292.1 hypothetical protein TRFO_04899 [Tritrichomonas foetus]